MLGHRRVLMGGIALFAVASLAAGMADSGELLLLARIAQGVGAAAASPAALALIPATFPEPAERARAMGVYAAMSGVGAATGLIVGGMLTEWVSWRWVFLLAVPFALAILALAPAALPEPPTRRESLSATSAVLVTAAVASLVYGVSRTPVHGWTDSATAAWIAAAAVLAIVFVLVEARRTTPLLPKAQLRILDKQVAWGAAFLLGAAMLSTMFFATQFMQQDLGFEPLQAGLGFIPFSAAMVVTSQFAARRVARTGPWKLIGVGAVLAASCDGGAVHPGPRPGLRGPHAARARWWRASGSVCCSCPSRWRASSAPHLGRWAWSRASPPPCSSSAERWAWLPW